jgi:hypothetical protein
MWHLKTKHGTFWLLKGERNRYHLGINNLNLGVYKDTDTAIKDVSDQNTGYLRWDSQSRISIPRHIEQWSAGEPADWEG